MGASGVEIISQVPEGCEESSNEEGKKMKKKVFESQDLWSHDHEIVEYDKHNYINVCKDHEWKKLMESHHVEKIKVKMQHQC